MSKVTCQLCAATTHSIQKHLNDVHGEGSDQPCTIHEYRDKFPDAPLLSKVAIEMINRAEAMKKKETTEKVSASNIDGVTMQPLRTLFGLPEKVSKTKSGKEIPIAVMDYQGDEEHIPDVDPHYNFHIENLKSCLLGLSENINTFVWGHAGVGKSSLIEQICARTKRRLVRVQHTVMTEESHIVGQWTVKADECPSTGKVVQKTVFELGLLPLAMKNGWTFLADEYDRCPPSVLSVYQAILEGKPLVIKEADHENRIIRPHKNFRFMATGNSNGSGDETGLYQSTMQQDAATMERFGIVIKQDYMPKDQEVAIVQGQAKIPKPAAVKIIDFCQKIRSKFPNDISITIGPRVAINIARIGVQKGDYAKGVELAYANRLPDSERQAAIEVAQRVFGSA